VRRTFPWFGLTASLQATTNSVRQPGWPGFDGHLTHPEVSAAGGSKVSEAAGCSTVNGETSRPSASTTDAA
jgi:hypothetical protein